MADFVVPDAAAIRRLIQEEEEEEGHESDTSISSHEPRGDPHDGEPGVELSDDDTAVTIAAPQLAIPVDNDTKLDVARHDAARHDGTDSSQADERSSKSMSSPWN